MHKSLWMWGFDPCCQLTWCLLRAKAEVSVLVDVLYRPELLFPAGPEARRKCENGGFIRRLITHTAALLEDKHDRLCVLILQTLRYEYISSVASSSERGTRQIWYLPSCMHSLKVIYRSPFPNPTSSLHKVDVGIFTNFQSMFRLHHLFLCD